MQVINQPLDALSQQLKPADLEELRKQYPHLGAVPSSGDIKVARRVFGTAELEPATADRHAKIIQPLCELCAQKGIVDIPKVMIAKSSVQNASVTGEGTMIISEGLMETLNQNEIRAVIMHELDHYKKREHDSTIAHAIGYFSDFLFGLLAGRKIDDMVERHYKLKDMPGLGKFISHTIPAAALHYLIVAPCHALFKRRSEFKADMEAAKTVGYENVIGVLKFFDELYESRQEERPGNIITRVRSNSVLDNMTAMLFPYPDHPTFKERIEKLEQAKAKDPNTRVTAAELQPQIQNAPTSQSVH